MQKRRLTQGFALFSAALLMAGSLISGCGSTSGGSSSGKTGHSSTTARKVGTATFKIKWPDRTRLIPLAADSIKIAFTGGAKPVTAKTVARPPDGENTTTVVFSDVPLGNYTITATAYPSKTGTGTAQATGTTTITVTNGQNADVHLTMASTIETLVSTTPLRVGVNKTRTLGATALDASNNMVLISTTLQWSIDNPGVATLDPNTGVLNTLSLGTATIHVTETESGKSADVALSVENISGLDTSSWPKFHGNAKSSGQATSGVATTGNIAAGFPVNLEATFSTSGLVLASNGNMYSGGQGGKVFGFDSTGAVLPGWPITVSDANLDISTPAIDGLGNVFVMSDDGNLYGIDGTTGDDIPGFPIPIPAGYALTFGDNFSQLPNAPAIGESGEIYIGNREGEVYAFNNDGTPVSGFPAGAGGSDNAVSSPAIDDAGNIYVGSSDLRGTAAVYSFTKDGTLRPGFPVVLTGATVTSPAIGPDGRIYIAAGPPTGGTVAVHVIPSTGGAASWTTFLPGTNMVSASVAVSDSGMVYVGTFGNEAPTTPGGQLFALNAGDGTIAWTFEAPFNTAEFSDFDPCSPAIGADGTVYVGSWNGLFYALNPADGSVKWSLDTGNIIQSSPAIGPDGAVYFGTDGFNLYKVQ